MTSCHEDSSFATPRSATPGSRYTQLHADDLLRRSVANDARPTNIGYLRLLVTVRSISRDQATPKRGDTIAGWRQAVLRFFPDQSGRTQSLQALR